MKSKEEKKNIRIWMTQYMAEREAHWLYSRLAEFEEKPKLAELYVKLAETEARHASVWAKRLEDAGVKLPEFRPGFQARWLAKRARKKGAASVVGIIADVEARAAGGYAQASDDESAQMEQEERSHARIFLSLAGKGVGGNELAKMEGRHKMGGNALRAGVLGANDGLVSVFCLVMGVAGAGVSQSTILITGGAGLIAGALSMALGEWLSVQSSREMYQNQISIEAKELDEFPEEEKEELALIYQAKGFPADEAKALANRLLDDKAHALDTLSREELGIDPEELGGSASVAAVTSFGLFALGAILPVVPFLFLADQAGIVTSALVSALGLFGLGAASSLMTGKNFMFSGLRMVLFGGVAAAITFAVGHLFGVHV